jgi:hypothetical protein
MVKEVILNKQLKAGACYSTAMPPVAAGSGDLLFSNCFVGPRRGGSRDRCALRRVAPAAHSAATLRQRRCAAAAARRALTMLSGDSLPPTPQSEPPLRAHAR